MINFVELLQILVLATKWLRSVPAKIKFVGHLKSRIVFDRIYLAKLVPCSRGIYFGLNTFQKFYKFL